HSSSPSFTWRSLVRTKDLIGAGLRWQIRDAASVPIVGTPWLPRPSTFQVILKPRSLSGNTTIAALLDESGWNVGLIREEFSQFDAECILSVPLPQCNRLDEIICITESRGGFRLIVRITLLVLWRMKLLHPVGGRNGTWCGTYNSLKKSGVAWSLTEPGDASAEMWLQGIYHRTERSEFERLQQFVGVYGATETREFFRAIHYR
ncbi:UNVERIFIED_CONTAM: hypothetical protein Slati_2926100, partial [Sesamum latifolium]